MLKIIVAGSRDYNDYETLKRELDDFIQTLDKVDIQIVSGTARGADALGERFAAERGYDVKRFPANWEKFGNMAGPLRNSDMSEYADACIVFWDGKSRGTKSMIHLSKMSKLTLKVVTTEEDKK